MRKVILNILYVASIIGMCAGMIKIIDCAAKKIESKEKKVKKFKSYYNLYDCWLSLKQRNISLENYFLDKNIKSIAIYGMGDIGMQLAMELENSSIDVKYVIDKNIYSDRVIYEKKSLDDELPIVDAVVVTPIAAFEKIEAQLSGYFSCPIICIEDIVYSL